MTLYRTRFSEQIEIIKAEALLSVWREEWQCVGYPTVEQKDVVSIFRLQSFSNNAKESKRLTNQNQEAARRSGHMKSRKSKWSEEELKQLAEIVAAGGTPLRAAAKLKRNMTSCRIQARAMGVPFSPLRVRQKNLRQKCAEAEKQVAR